MTFLASGAPYAGQNNRTGRSDHKSDSKAVTWHQCPDAQLELPLPQHATAPTARTPSGRSVCVFSRNDRQGTVDGRQGQMQAAGFLGVVAGMVGAAATALAYWPSIDDPHGVAKRNAVIVTASLGPALSPLLLPLYWHLSDRRDLDARFKAEQQAVSDLTPKARLERHVATSNAVRETVWRRAFLTDEALGKAIAFMHTLQSESEGALSNDQVAQAIADLIDGAVSVGNKRAFGMLTEGLAQMAVSGRCEPATVLDLLQSVFDRAMKQLEERGIEVFDGVVEPYERTELVQQLKQEREAQLATAIVKTVGPQDEELSPEQQATVTSAWTSLAKKNVGITEVMAFARLVLVLAVGDSPDLNLEPLMAYAASVKPAQGQDGAKGFTAADGVLKALREREAATPFKTALAVDQPVHTPTAPDAADAV